MSDRTTDHHGDTIIFTDRPPRLLPRGRDLAGLQLFDDLNDRISASDPYAPLAFVYTLVRAAVFLALFFGTDWGVVFGAFALFYPPAM